MSALAAADLPRGTSTHKDVTDPDWQTLEHIPLDKLDIGDNVRVDPGELEELADSIRELGVLQPIRAIGPDKKGRYRAVWGQRRILASRLAERTTIPALVEASGLAVDKAGPRRSIEQLAENLQRKDLNAIEEAVALRDVLAGEEGLTQAELAKRLGRSAPWVANTLRLLETAPEVQARVRAGELTAAHAKAIASVDVDLQADFAAHVVEQGSSAHDTERQAKWAQQTAKETRARKAATEKHVKAAIAMLEKVANRKTSKIGVADYGGSTAKGLLKADGWKVVDGWDVQTVTQAGECGCPSVWRLQLPYNASGKVELNPACASKEHADARRAAQQAEWEARNEAEAARRKADADATKRRAEGLQAFLEAELATTFGKRLLLYGLIQDGDDDNLIDRYWDGDRQAVYDLDDAAWTLIERVPDEELVTVIAATLSDILTGWSAGSGVTAALDARMAELTATPDPAPAKKRRAPTT